MLDRQVTVLWVGERRDLPLGELVVSRCENPAWIVDAVERDAPDLLVVDLGSPALQGLEVITELRKSELTRIVPLVVLSRDEGIEWRAELFRAGAADVVLDTTAGEELLRRLRDALRGRRPWGGAALAAGTAPAVGTIAELQRQRASAIVEVADGKRRGAVRIEQGTVTAAAVGGYVGEEALNCIAGRSAWRATVRPIVDGVAAVGPPHDARFTPLPESEFTPVPHDPFAVLGVPLVLLVEDDDAARRLLEISLGRRGFRIATAASGADALEAARRETPDVILSDVMMPRGDGWWLLSQVRQDFALRETPVVLFTNKGVASHPLQDLGIRPDAFTQKDPHVASVVRLLEGALEPLRTLHVRAAAAAASGEPLEGTLESPGPLGVLRVLRAARRRGWLKMRRVSGAGMTVGLRDDLIFSATVEGPSPVEGRDALVQLVALDWQAFRFEPDDVPGAGALGPAVAVLSEACARGQRFFERMRAFGLAPGGAVQADPDALVALGPTFSPQAAPVVRALARQQAPADAARTTGIAPELVDAILLDMLRRGAIVVAGLDTEPVAEMAGTAGGGVLLPGADRRAAEAEGRARAAEDRARAVAQKAATFEAQARQSAVRAGKVAADAMADAERRMADLERRAHEAEGARDAAARAGAEATTRAEALGAEQRRMEQLEHALDEARTQAARMGEEASRVRTELELAAAGAVEAREARAALERSLQAMRERQTALEEQGGPGVAAASEEALSRLRGDVAAGEQELVERTHEMELRESKLAEADAAMTQGRSALHAARNAMEAQLRELAPREEALAVREAELGATEVRLQAERDALEKMRAGAEGEAAHLRETRDGDRHTVGRMLAELERLRAIATRAVREAEVAKEATARMLVDTAATRGRGEALAAQVAQSRSDYAALGRLYDEPTLIRPMPMPPVALAPAARAGGEDAGPLAHWGSSEPTDVTPDGPSGHQILAPPRGGSLEEPSAPATAPSSSGRAPVVAAQPPAAPDLFEEPAAADFEHPVRGRLRGPGETPPSRDAPADSPLRQMTPPRALGGPVSPTPLPVVRPSPPWTPARRSWRRAAGMVTAGATLAAAASLVLWLALRPRDPDGRVRDAGARVASVLPAPLPRPSTVAPADDVLEAATSGTASAAEPADASEDGSPKAKKKGKKKGRKPKMKGPDGEPVTAGSVVSDKMRARAAALADEGTRHLLTGDAARAIARFKEAASADPTAPEPCRGLVYAYVARDMKPLAEKALDCYLRLRPDAPEAADLRGRIARLK